MDGKSFFYTNAMEIKNIFHHKDMEAGRSGWFPCSCCPTNVTRLIPSIPGYVYGIKDDNIYINLFVAGVASFEINKKQIQIEQVNNYPWDGGLTFKVGSKASTPFTMKIRIPGWARNEAIPSDLYRFDTTREEKIVIKINGKPVNYSMDNGYAVISRVWKKGDVVQMELPMEIRRVVANDKAEDDRGKVALQRGPLMYCAEWPDNQGLVSNIVLPDNVQLTSEYKSDLLNGVTILKGEVSAIHVNSDTEVSTGKQPFIAIPYYAWAHRGKGEMIVWFPKKVKGLEIVPSY
jgi:DUF1680 family protein